MNQYLRLLLANRAWSDEINSTRAGYFETLARSQAPDFLWIGCSDSRVPAEEVTCARPGEIFVHRNVANLVVENDINLLSVLQYAVEVLKVKHVIVCGHYGCGGVRAAALKQGTGLVAEWISHIDTTDMTFDEHNEAKLSVQLNDLVDRNVKNQISNIAKTKIVQQAWQNGQEVCIHGWVFDLASGTLKPLARIDRAESLEVKLTNSVGECHGISAQRSQ